MRDKYADLQRLLAETGGVAIAFSGGVDSTFLAAAAVEALKGRTLAVTALSPTYPEGERREASDLARRIGIQQVEVETHELEDPRFSANPPDRCYYCKRELVELVRKVATEHGLEQVSDGSTLDDLNDHRPGRRAMSEGHVRSLLVEAGFTKADVREYSRRMGLPTADKPSLACLASRIPYGTRITADKLRAVDAVEQALREAGFGQVRVRHHGDVARLELDTAELRRVFDTPVRERVVAAAKEAGFLFVAVDLEGYRTGSMNAALAGIHGPGST